METSDKHNDYLSARRLFEQKDFTAAKPILDTLLATDPDHLDALQLAARIAAFDGNWAQSQECLKRALTIAPDHPRLRYEFAVTLEKLGQTEAAIDGYRHALEIAPGLVEAHRRLADLLASQGDLEQAQAHYQQVLTVHPDQYQTLLLLSQTMERQGRSTAFIQYCRQLIERAPDYAGAYLQLGIMNQKQGNFDAAIANYREVIAREPNCYDAFWYTGMIHRVRGEVDEAIEWLENAVRIRPQRNEAKALLCDAYEAVNKLGDAESLAREVLDNEPHNPLAARVLASILRRDKRLEEGYALLSSVPVPNDPHEAQAVCFELGRLADASGPYEAAFSHFEQDNAALAIAQKARDEDKIAYRKKLALLRETFTPEWIGSWQSYPKDDDQTTPVFLVGFPRSGTTLIDQILDCHPNIQVMEERPIMFHVQSELERMTGNDPRALANLSVDQWRQLRERYLSMANEYIEPGQGALIVDKLPLNIVRAGICFWLFPEARFIFAVRHPCDVVLSCFMQSFAFNQAMANFYTLEDGALLYDRVMDLWRHYRSILPIACHQYRYEDLVDDFEPTVRGILEFLDQPWHPDVMNFDRRARERGYINTPSYSQVSRPIYRSSRFRWQRYREQMAGVLPLLEPWAKTFGYDD